MRIVICGGHLTPALATIEALKKEEDNVKIFFFGRLHSIEGDKSVSWESKIIPSLGLPFYSIITGRLQRKFTIHTIPSLFRIPIGFLQSFFLLLKIRPDLICSFGSYVAVPPVIAGWILRIPIITHEQTKEMGLASKIVAFFAKKIILSYQGSSKILPNSKIILAGNPIRDEIFDYKIRNKKLKAFLEESKIPLIYVTGGNQGSHIINETVANTLEWLLKRYHLLIQTGDSKVYKDFEMFKRLVSSLPANLAARIWIVKYLYSDEIGSVLENMDLIIGRSGANIVWEVGALGKVAIFIPIPWVQNDEQTKNAQILFDLKSAEILSQSLLSPKTLAGKIEFIFKNFEKYKNNAMDAKKLFPRDGAQKLAQEIFSISKKIKH
jgi:UDP-N-acetylglucosamine--N-acetylmuramyl-(pentapeptide) pyrophosphoryl-undecaprenol N-acetylglucosamine transferase